MNNGKPDISSYIKQLRTEKGYTHLKLSRLSNVSQPYLSQIEVGTRKPSIDILRKLSTALESDFYELARIAGYYTDEEVIEMKGVKSVLDSVGVEVINERLLSSSLDSFKKREYPQIEDYLLSEKPLYANKHLLTQQEKKILYKIITALFEESEVNYPSDEEILKLHEEEREMKIKMNDFIKRKEEERREEIQIAKRIENEKLNN